MNKQVNNTVKKKKVFTAATVVNMVFFFYLFLCKYKTNKQTTWIKFRDMVTLGANIMNLVC